jgi:hypothetical protein
MCPPRIPPPKSFRLAAQVLAGEFNLALEISREKLYKS